MHLLCSPCAASFQVPALVRDRPLTYDQDILIILFSSCSRLFPRRRGYNQLPTYSSRGRGSSRDDENRLIDQLDEEWDD